MDEKYDVVETANNAGHFRLFLQALEAAGLKETLKETGPYTVLAPVDDAFIKMPQSKLHDLFKTENRESQLRPCGPSSTKLEPRLGSKKAGYDIAGKTGTAQVVGLGKDTGRNKDHAWFVSYAPAFKPEIAVLALIENSGFGSRHAAPAARALYDVYFEKAPGGDRLPQHIAQNPR